VAAVAGDTAARPRVAARAHNAIHRETTQKEDLLARIGEKIGFPI
jgi:hypothetical protein